MKTGVSEGKVKFDIGSQIDSEHFYFLYYSPEHNTDAPYIHVCIEIKPDGNRSNLEVPCSEFNSDSAISFFNSDELDSFAFPNEAFIEFPIHV